MNKYAVLGELLYIISNYEKGRINVKNIWTRKYVTSLQLSLNIMSAIIVLLKKNFSQDSKVILQLSEYIERQSSIIFPDVISKDSLEKCLCNLIDDTDMKEYEEIIYLMEVIVSDCQIALMKKPRNYKKIIANSLRAFHNLPRVFMNSRTKTIFNINVTSIDKNDAFVIANSYIKRA